MTDWLGHAVAALLVSYGVSRLLRRVPIAAPEPRRSLIVHALSALLVAFGVYALRQSGPALLLPLVAQGGWLLLDVARARAGGGGGVRVRAG